MAISDDDPIYGLRRQVAAAIVRALRGDQHHRGPGFGISQPRMSELIRGNVRRCSLEWLLGKVAGDAGDATLHSTPTLMPNLE